MEERQQPERQQLEQQIINLLAREPQDAGIERQIAFLKERLKAGKFIYYCLIAA